MKRNIRGYSLEIGIELFKRTLFIEIIPFKWRMPFCAIPNGQPAMAASPHMYVGPFHIWLFDDGGATIGLTFDLDYNQFWKNRLTLGHGMKRIF